MAQLYIGSTIGLMIGVLAQAVAFIVLARYLGTEQFGHLMTMTAVTSLANTWCGFGPGEVLRRVVGRDVTLYPEALGHTVLMIAWTGIVLTAVVLFGMLLFSPVVADPSQNLEILLLFIPTNVVLPSYILLAESNFLARGDFFRANLINGGSGVARALTAVAACVVFGVTSLRDWALWWTAVHVAMCIVCFGMTWRFGRPRWRVLQKEALLGGNLALSSFLIMLRHNIDILVLSAVTTPDFVGVYGAGRRLIGAALIVPGSFDRLIYSKLVVAGKEGASATLRLAKKYLVYSVMISAVTSLALFFVAPLTPWIFGSSFNEASNVIRVLCWTVVSTAIQFLAFDALNAAEGHRLSAVISGSANLAGAAMVVALGSVYGTLGIYFALYSSDIVRGGGLWLALNRLGIQQDRFHRR
jgi:O-antigen/teichoic acid export membrane protein